LKPLNIPSWFWTLIRVIVSTGLIVWLVFHYNWGEVLTALIHVPAYVLAIGLIFLFASQAVTARRLQVLLAGQTIELNYLYVLKLNFAGLFASNYLPSTIGGDAFKLILLARDGARKTIAATSIAADRLISVASMVFFFPSIYSLIGLFRVRIGLPDLKITIAASALLLVLLVLALFIYRKKDLVTNNLPSWAKSLLIITSDIKEIANIWFAKPQTILMVIFLSISSFLCSFFATWLLLSWGLGIKIQPVEWIAISVLVYLITILPISVNGLGLQETGFVYLLSQFGAAPERSLTFALLIRLLTMAVSLPGIVSVITPSEKHIQNKPG
jgi:glycosyltransferase 2 family protein